MYRPPYTLLTSKFLARAVSFVLAAVIFLNPLQNVVFADASETTPWVYDVARVTSSVNASSQYGDYQENYPIDLPTGVNGLTPQLQLSYSSQAGGYGSFVGYGWNITQPSIQRINKNGVNQLYSRDDYQSSYDGELTELLNGEYVPRMQTGSFKTYALNNDSWEMYGAEGVKYVFGSTTESRQKANSTSTDTFAWYLNEIIDTNGNKIVYEYVQNQGKVYLSKILYGYDSLGSNAYEVKFTYASSSKYTSYESGFASSNDRILTAIKLYFNETLLTQYDLDYETPTGSVVNLLSSIHKVGYDENGNGASTSPKLFDYTEQSPSWTNQPTIATTAPSYLLEQITASGQNSTHYSRDVLIDMNGDGLTDWVEGDHVFLNNGSGWEASPTWPTLPVSETYHKSRLADVNGDLLPDIITSDDEIFDPQFNGQNPDVYTREVRINQGDGTWVLDASWADTIPTKLYMKYWNYPSGISVYDYDVFITDMNGDGLSDWVYGGYVYLNTGSGWATSSSWAQMVSGTEPFNAKWRLADVNGDGLPDLIKSDTTMYDPQFNGQNQDVYTNEVWMNLGNGNWERDPVRENTLPTEFSSRFYIKYFNYPSGITYYQNKVYLADVNGDGLNDWLYSDKALLNTGAGWGTSAITLPVQSSELLSSYRLTDIDGDAQLDYVQYHYRYFFGTQTYTKKALVNDAQKQWLLATTTDEFGGVTSVTYGVTTAQQNGQLFNPKNPIVQYVVSDVTKYPLIGETVAIQFSYAGGDFYYASNSPFDRKFAGFGSTTVQTSTGKTTTYYHQGNSNSTSSYEANDNYSKIGLPYRSEVYDLNDNLYKTTISNYALYARATSSDFVKKIEDITLQYDGDSDHKDSATALYYDDETGLVSSEIEYGEVSSSLAGSFSDIGSDKRITEYVYASSSPDHILGLLTQESLKDGAGTKVRESKFYYDNQPLGSVQIGNMTKQENWVSGSTYVDTKWSYNSQGQVISETDPLNHISLYDYDSYGLFVSSTTNAADHNSQYQYDYSSGEVATTTDPNGRVSVTVFDGLDRPLAILISDPQSGSLVQQTTYAYTDNAGARHAAKTNHLNNSLSSITHSYFDGFGKVIQARVGAEDNNQYAVADYLYGDHGLLQKESLPYYSNGASRTAATVDTDLLSLRTYDPLSRVTAVQTTVGTTNYSYDQWQEIITDTANNDKTIEYDAYGRLINVIEEEGLSSYDTAYDWNPADDLIKVTDAVGNVRNLTYDGLGRRVSLEDLHDATDGTYGTWAFTYDAVGNKISTTDPKGQVVNYTYDDVNRVLTEDYLGTGFTDVVYDYDACSNGITRLCLVSNENATTTYTYTPNGLVASEIKAISGTTYTTAYEYDRLGNQTLITYPDNSEVKYTYNKANKVEKVEQRENGGSFSEVIKDFDYGPHGQVTLQVSGNNAKTTKTYDENELYRLRSLVTTASSTYGTGGPGPEFAQIEAELPLITSATTSNQTTDTITSITNPVSITPTTTTQNASTEEVATSTSNATSSVLEISSSVASSSSMNPVINTTTGIITDMAIESRADKVSTEKADTKNFRIDQGQFELTQLDRDKDKKVTVIAKDNIPEIRFQKWSGEIDFGITYEDNEFSNANAKLHNNNLIRWQSSSTKTEVHAYPLKPDMDMEGGGFEIEIVLSDKPKQNTFDFKIDGYKDLDFFYQPPLTDESIQGEICTETQCVDDTGEITRERAENVVGSYAVYHQNKKDHVLNGRNYATGKVFQIYRPKITDANDNSVWGKLEYKNGKLTVTVPQAFLDSATYPVTVDPTFGNTNVGGSLYNSGENNHGSIFTAPSQAGDIASISSYRKQSHYATQCGAAVYSNLSGSPKYPLAVDAGNQTVTTGSPQWYTWNVSYTYTPSVGYWLNNFCNAQSGNQYIYYDSGVSGNSFRKFGTFENWHNPVPSPIFLSHIFSIYATYTVGSSTNATPTAPTLLKAEGQTNPTDITDNTPEFTAVYNDPDSGDKALYYLVQVDDNSDFSSTVWDSAKTGMATTSEGVQSPNISYSGSALASSTDYYWRIKFWDDDDVEGAWSTSTATFSLAAAVGGWNATPTAPTLLETEGQINPTNLTDSTPEFTAVYNDPDSGDIGTGYQIQVDDNSDFSSVYWDSGSTTLATSTSEGNRSETIEYSGSSLASSTTYYWRIKFWDDSDAEGEWSTTTATFSLAAASSIPVFPIFRELIQNITYGYDSVGNITQIADASDTSLSATTTYTYDNLNRLTSASTSLATTSPYTHSYTYSPIGNLLTKSDVGSYSYAETGYANPHAATSINGVTYTYDQNGNLASTSAGATYDWNYKNQLVESEVNGDITTYSYDHEGSRVRKVTASTTSYYPNNLYEVTGTTTKKHLYANNTLIATIESDTPAPAIYYAHTNHLGSTNVVTDKDGYINQLLDYYPFGDTRIENQYNTSNQTKRYTGHEYDTETNLNYMQARYQSGTEGRFYSQDPASLESIESLITDPQLLNTYSYSKNNPIKNVDPTGEIPILAAFVAAIATLASDFAFNANYAYAPAQSFDVSLAPQSTSPLGQFAYGGNYDSQSALTKVVFGLTAGSLDGNPFNSYGSIKNSYGAIRASDIVGSNIGYGSFSAFKNANGVAGTGRHWHHIVEQNPSNLRNFGQYSIQNTSNLVKLPAGIHYKISGHYSSKPVFTNGLTVRDWLKQQSYDEQYEYGQSILNRAINDEL